MEGRSVLRRAQSLRSVSTADGDKPTWAEAGFRDRMKSISSVSQTRYQASPSVEVPTPNHVEHRTERTQHQSSFSSVSEKTKLESLMRNNGEKTRIQPSVSEVREKTCGSTSLSREKSQRSTSLSREKSQRSTSLSREKSQRSTSLSREKSQRSTSLSRSESMSSLPGPSPRADPAGGIGALKALFESKVTKGEVKSIMGAVGQTPPRPKMAAAAPAVNGLVEERKRPIEEKGSLTAVGSMTRSERRKTISGVNLDKISTASQDDDKRKSISDLRDGSSSSSNPAREKPDASVSVRAISALYLSKVAAAESTAQDLSSPTKRGGKPSKDYLSDLFGVGVGAGVWGNVKRTSALFEQPWDSQNIQEERVKGPTDQVERADAAHGDDGRPDC
ncbi:unnamed protein product [Coregonus sp. 'balchen']|nr:unnamed protein product [Coregonus sp. 'balchen']